MSQWCPRCGGEYIEGWGTCSECGVELVDERPAIARPPDRDEIHIEPPRERSYDDPFVAIWEGPTPEGTLLARKLEASHIPVELGEAAEPGRLRLEVPHSYIDEAYGALDAADPYVLEEPPAPDEETDAWAEPVGWAPWARILFAVVALALVVVLIVTST